MTSSSCPASCSQKAAPALKIRLSPKKLLLSKWTAVAPADKEKHFVVTRVVRPVLPGERVEWVEIEAVHSRRSSVMRWRDLCDGDQWRRGWA